MNFDIKDYPMLFTHNLCRNIAFYTEEVPLFDECILQPEQAIFPDGTKPEAGEPMNCFSCKINIRQPLKDNLTVWRLER